MGLDVLGTSADGALGVEALVVHRDDEDREAGAGGLERLHALAPAQPAHRHVGHEQVDVGRVGLDVSQRVSTVRSDQGHPVLVLQKLTQNG